MGLTAVALAGGCTAGDDGPDSPGADGGEPDPDLDLLARAIGEKQDLLDGYAATTARHAPLAERLAPMRADHEAHLAALTGFRPDLPAPAAVPSAGPSASASPTGPTAASDRARAVEDLAAAEHTAANRRIGQCETARDPKLARLLASIGGCEAAHTAVLRAGS
jgi:hypothetical protein